MKILSIETSADETGVSVIAATGEFPHANYEILGNALHSQIKLHTEYGGIFPAMAKREHAKAIVPLLKLALEEAELLEIGATSLTDDQLELIRELCDREPGLADTFFEFFASYNQPEIDLIAVTTGPGLEPALWVGINFAKALSAIWNIKTVPVNHMEGHVLASIYDVEADEQLVDLPFPTIALLISGGHTELDLMRDWGSYERIGQTRDDAVGEAFDKVARLLGLPYPGGPEISRLAAAARAAKLPAYATLPRPMLQSGDLDFSFSGLKTAVRYAVAEKELSDTDKQAIARDFEDAATEVLVKKTLAAIEQCGAQALIVGGGVSANQHIKRSLQAALLEYDATVIAYFPNPGLSTDNAIMIALAGHARARRAGNPVVTRLLTADGNRSISTLEQN